MTKFIIQHIRLLLLTFIMMCATTVSAQYNPDGVNEQLLPLFNRAYKHRHEKAGLLAADTLFKQAVAMGDSKTACLALGIPIFHYQNKNDEQAFNNACTRLEKYSLDNKQNAYYVFAQYQRIQRLIDHNHVNKALAMMEKLRQNAAVAKEHEAEFGLTGMVAYIHYLKGDRHKGDSCTLEAINIKKRHLPDMIVSYSYLSLAESARLNKNYDQAIYYADMGLKESKHGDNTLNALLNKCETLFEAKRGDEYKKTHDQFIELKKEWPNRNNNSQHLLQAYRHTIDGDTATAFKIVSQMKNQEMKRRATHAIAAYCSDWKRALLALNEISLHKDKYYRSIIKTELYDAAETSGNMQLAMANNRIALDNAQLLLDESQLKMGIDEANNQNNLTLIAHRNMEISHLQLAEQKRNATLARERTEKQRLKELADQERLKSRYDIAVMLITVIGLLIVIGILAMHTRNHRRHLQQLRDNHESLLIASNQATEADRTKTEFLEKMGFEVRTPLNAVLGFSQLLCSPDNKLSEEEREKYMAHIQANTEMLSNLINQILDSAARDNKKQQGK